MDSIICEDQKCFKILIKGKQLLQFLEEILKSRDPQIFPLVSGLQNIKFTPSAPFPFQWSDVQDAHGSTIDQDREYTVVVTEALVTEQTAGFSGLQDGEIKMVNYTKNDEKSIKDILETFLLSYKLSQENF